MKGFAGFRPFEPFLRVDPFDGPDVQILVPIDPRDLFVQFFSVLVFGREDALHFVHQEIAADGVVAAQIESIEATSSSASVDLMWRESLDASARYAAMLVDRRGRLYLRYRPAAGVGTQVDRWSEREL